MISLIGLLSLVSALTATSSALLCTECDSLSSTCSGNRKSCASGFACGSTYTQIFAEGVKTESLVRGCLTSSACNFSGTMSIKEGRLGVGTSCCSSDDCTPALPTFPPNSNPNNLTCRSCFSGKSTWCYTSDTIQCTGDENMCILQTTETTGLASAMRGCATKSFCDLGRQSYKAGGSPSNVKITCTNGGISAHKVVLTPAILCLLLLKLFL